MLFTRKLLAVRAFRIYHTTRPQSTTSNNEGFLYNPKFSSSEQEKILTTINESNTEQLSRFDMSRTRIKNLETWRNKKGPFRSLSDILEVEGLGVKVLERLCESIILDKKDSAQPKAVTNNSKARKLLLTPPLFSETFTVLKTAVGVHLDPTGVSWAKLHSDNNKLQEWNFYDFSALPKRMLPVETFDLTIDILKALPTGDVYILEAQQSLNSQNQAVALSYNHQQELMSMLLALINTSPAHNPTVNRELQEKLISCENKVHFLRSKVPARLFRTLVGTEKVSATSTVKTLLENTESSGEPLPCTCITVDKHLKDMYYEIPAMHRDLLGQSLLLVTSFMDLCIYKNPVSLKAIAPGANRSR